MKYCQCKAHKYTGNYIDSSVGAIIAALALFFEPKSRRTEISLFIVPRWFETIWNMAIKRELVKNIKFAETIIFALGAGILTVFY